MVKDCDRRLNMVCLPSPIGGLYHSVADYEFLFMFMNVIINNDVVISEICMWVSMVEDDPFLHPHPFIDKGTYNIPMEGFCIRPMGDSVNCRNIDTLSHIFFCLNQLLEVPQFHRESALQYINDTWNLIHIYYIVTDQQIHMVIMEDNSNMSNDSLEQLRLRIT